MGRFVRDRREGVHDRVGRDVRGVDGDLIGLVAVRAMDEALGAVVAPNP